MQIKKMKITDKEGEEEGKGEREQALPHRRKREGVRMRATECQKRSKRVKEANLSTAERSGIKLL